MPQYAPVAQRAIGEMGGEYDKSPLRGSCVRIDGDPGRLEPRLADGAEEDRTVLRVRLIPDREQ
jgi:hypothetical protein